MQSPMKNEQLGESKLEFQFVPFLKSTKQKYLNFLFERIPFAEYVENRIANKFYDLFRYFGIITFFSKYQNKGRYRLLFNESREKNGVSKGIFAYNL